MTEARAREILRSLVQGINPFTTEELYADSLLQHAEVLRAMLAGISALEQLAARSARRASLPQNIGRNWSAEEQASLIESFQAGEALADIAARHGRTVRAIESRLEKLGLISAEQRATRDRFTGTQPTP